MTAAIDFANASPAFRAPLDFPLRQLLLELSVKIAGRTFSDMGRGMALGANGEATFWA